MESNFRLENMLKLSSHFFLYFEFISAPFSQNPGLPGCLGWSFWSPPSFLQWFSLLTVELLSVYKKKKSFYSFVWTKVNRAVLKAQTQALTAQKPLHTWCSRRLGTSRTSNQAELSKKFCTFLKCQADHDEYKNPELRGSAEGASRTSLWRWSCSPSSTWPWSRHRTQTKAWRSGHWSPPSPPPWALGQRTEPGPES